MRRCTHGVYWPQDQPIALFCQSCNPLTNLPESIASAVDTPKFNRRNALTITSTGKLPKCPVCQGNSILTVSNAGKCSICHTQFTIDAPQHLRANNHQPGICPNCQSGVHFEVDSKTWKCADCDTNYKAPRRISE